MLPNTIYHGEFLSVGLPEGFGPSCLPWVALSLKCLVTL